MSAILHYEHGSSTGAWLRELDAIEAEGVFAPLPEDLAPEVEVPRIDPREFDQWYDRDRYICERSDERSAERAEQREEML